VLAAAWGVREPCKPMDTTLISPQTPANRSPETTGHTRRGPDERTRTLLQRAFGAPLYFFDVSAGEWIEPDDQLPECDWRRFEPAVRRAAQGSMPEIIYEQDPLLALGLPLPDAGSGSSAGVGLFLTRPAGLDDLRQPGDGLGASVEQLARWAEGSMVWQREALLRVAELVVLQLRADRRIEELEQETADLSAHLASTYEEISLLHRLAENLRLSQADEELGRVALEWLQEVVPAQGLALQLLPLSGERRALTHEFRTEPLLLKYGSCGLDNAGFTELMAHFGDELRRRPIVVNRPLTQRPDWPFPEVRQLIAVALIEGDNLFGYLAAINHADDAEFGTVEASLLSSVAAILGIHSGNIELYRQQSELLAGIVRALTSAIDAKDPYTCGHSDRVARIAVRLAEELGCEGKVLNTVYLSGLLHDIGKIGISDAVLRKPDRLSPQEYEHIKRHVRIGYRILSDIAKLEDVLPVVLHHHESWDGAGYPDRLASSRIPLIARIVAVADSYDAMSSDRPYRKGMPEEKIDAIFREGAGKQWDPEVIEAFFRAREDIRRIAHQQEDDAQSAAREFV